MEVREHVDGRCSGREVLWEQRLGAWGSDIAVVCGLLGWFGWSGRVRVEVGGVHREEAACRAGEGNTSASASLLSLVMALQYLPVESPQGLNTRVQGEHLDLCSLAGPGK